MNEILDNTSTWSEGRIDSDLRDHMNKVYRTMGMGLLITFAAAWAVGSNEMLASVFMNPSTAQPNGLGVLIMFLPLLMIFVSGWVMKLSSAAVQMAFYIFSAVMGLSLASIFVVYTGVSIAQTFLVTSVSFLGLSLWGYTTKRDISGWGAFLFMGLFGIIAASIINFFLASSAVAFAVSVLGVLIFAGLTAYDTQKIKTAYLEHAQHADEEWLSKSATLGALDLYLDFINLFLHLLRFLGNRE